LSETSQLDIVEDDDDGDAVDGEEVVGDGNQGENSV
jgi:hypothetical protein